MLPHNTVIETSSRASRITPNLVARRRVPGQPVGRRAERDNYRHPRSQESKQQESSISLSEKEIMREIPQALTERAITCPFLMPFARLSPPSPPIWLMRQAGRYLPEYRAVRQQAGGFLDLCYNPELASEVTLQPVRRFHFDAAILFSDILVGPHALGQHVTFAEGEGPRLAPIRSREDIDRLDKLQVGFTFAPVHKTVLRTRAALPRDTALIGFCGAPWTVATYM